MSQLMDIINPAEGFGIGTLFSDKVKKASNKHRSILLGEKTSLNIEQDFMITPDLDKSLMSAIKGKIYEESY
jgi:hypothetical protein